MQRAAVSALFDGLVAGAFAEFDVWAAAHGRDAQAIIVEHRLDRGWGPAFAAAYELVTALVGECPEEDPVDVADLLALVDQARLRPDRLTATFLYVEGRDWERTVVARAVWAPVELVPVFAVDECGDVRAVAAREAGPWPEVLEALTGDPDERVRTNIVLNWETPRALLERLAQDRLPWIASQARLRLSTVPATPRKR